MRFLLWMSLLICTPIVSAVANTTYNTTLSPLACNLPAPSGLTVTDVTTNSIDIAWNPVAGASAYAVKFIEDATGTVVLNTTVTGTTATANSLNSGTTYRFTVAAICPDGSESGNESTGKARTEFIVVDDLVVNYPTTNEQIIDCDTFSSASTVNLSVFLDGENQTDFTLTRDYSFQALYDLIVTHNNEEGNDWIFTNETDSFPTGPVSVTATAVKVYHGSGAIDDIIGTENNHVLTFKIELTGSTLNQISFCIINIAPAYAVYTKTTSRNRPGTTSGTLVASENNTLSVNPNPFKDELNVQLAQATDTNGALQLIDARGRVLRNQTFEAGFQALSIPTTDLASGLYFVRMETSKGVSTFKVVKSN